MPGKQNICRYTRNVCTYAYMNMCMYFWISMFVCTYVCVCMYVFLYVRVRMYVGMYDVFMSVRLCMRLVGWSLFSNSTIIWQNHLTFLQLPSLLIVPLSLTHLAHIFLTPHWHQHSLVVSLVISSIIVCRVLCCLVA